MRTLREGCCGEDVKAWKLFLRGIDPQSSIDTQDDHFDSNTTQLTKLFQVRTCLPTDGVVGPVTLGKAMILGFDPMTDDSSDESGPNWPTCPEDVKPLSSAEREELFGSFTFKPTNQNESVVITSDWATKNIVTIAIPQLECVSGCGSSGKISVHKAIAGQITNFFQAIEDEGLKQLVKTWGGAFNPRFIRGSKTVLSNHSWGTAFDINVQWNMLGTRPALKGQLGSVRELVEIAVEHGFYWGGWFGQRPDGMHFEAYKVIC